MLTKSCVKNWLPFQESYSHRYCSKCCNWLTQYQSVYHWRQKDNMFPSAKRLLKWHFWFGHQNICDTRLSIWSLPFGTDTFLSSSNFQFEQIPKCEVCQYAKAERKAIYGKKIKMDVAHEGSLRDNHLRPGSNVSVDNFKYRLKGRTYTSLGSSTY